MSIFRETKECFLYTMLDRTADTLLNYTKTIIKLGAIIIIEPAEGI